MADPRIRIMRVSRLMSWIATAGIAGLAALSIYLVGDPAALERLAATMPEFALSQTGFTDTKWWLSAGLLTFTLAPAFYLLMQIRKLFTTYSAGEIFTIGASDTLRRIGTAFLVLACVSVLSNTALVLIATYDNPQGQRSLALSLGSKEYALILIGGLISVIGWVMSEAAQISDENRQFV